MTFPLPPSEIWLLSGMMLVTFSVRYLPLALSDRLHFSGTVQQALAYVPPAVLTAIIVPAVLVSDGSLWVDWRNPRLIGAIAAVGVGLWRKHLLLTLLAGMGAFLLWKTMGGM